MTPSLPLVFLKTQPSMFMHSQDSKVGETAMAPTTTVSTWHLQRAQQSNPRVREIRYISFSKNIGSTQWSKLCKKKKKKNKDNQTIFPWPFGWISKMGLTTKSRFDEMSNHNYSIWDLGSPQAKSPPPPRRVWIQMPSRWNTWFETWVVPKPNHPSMCLDSNAKPLNHPIWDLNKFKVLN